MAGIICDFYGVEEDKITLEVEEQFLQEHQLFDFEGERYIIFASRNGGPKHPDWYFNLVANPDVQLEVKGEAFAASASVPAGDEAERLWSHCISQRPFLADMRQKALPRQLPLIVLERQEASA